MQVEVHHIHAVVAGAHQAGERVHVGPVHVQQRAFVVENPGDRADVLLEHPQRVGVGDHQRGHVLIDHAGQCRDVDHPALVRLNVADLVTRDGRGGRVGAVRRVGDQHRPARVAARGQQRAGHQNARQLAMRAGGRLQGDGVHAGDLEERRFQPRHDLESALGQGFGLVGMHPGQALHLRHTLVDARVVLHGARAKRIHA